MLVSAAARTGSAVLQKARDVMAGVGSSWLFGRAELRENLCRRPVIVLPHHARAWPRAEALARMNTRNEARATGIKNGPPCEGGRG